MSLVSPAFYLLDFTLNMQTAYCTAVFTDNRLSYILKGELVKSKYLWQ